MCSTSSVSCVVPMVVLPLEGAMPPSPNQQDSLRVVLALATTLLQNIDITNALLLVVRAYRVVIIQTIINFHGPWLLGLFIVTPICMSSHLPIRYPVDTYACLTRVPRTTCSLLLENLLCMCTCTCTWVECV